MNISLTLILCAVLVSVAVADEFHKGGVGTCSVCHVIHTLADGNPVVPTADNNYLLRENTPSDLCLSCHATSNGAVWSNNPLVPAPQRGAGNFIFEQAANLNDAPDGAQHPLSGGHGVHNCVAPSQNSDVDPVHDVAPGGSYPSKYLGCTSCHDPHGNTNFRMLWGVGHIPAGDFTFMYSAPYADGTPLDSAAESRTLHTAYHSGWTNWCRNCHGLYHADGSQGFEHPVDGPLTGHTRVSYELYDGSGNPTGGIPQQSYLPEVPFESRTVTINSTNGPEMQSRIACITCHRAHGSSAVDLGRWDFRVANLRLDGSPSGSYPIPNPYTSGTIERSLCVKCHEQDTRTHGFTQACIECHREETLVREKLDPARPVRSIK
ncbi:MAG: hypothetical protein H6508_00205 [Calditrichaeota bacterium]|nr:hypothetical protein [Calditrichota bacterium]MCB9365594.1 hypothetical protein [Calditrichota bacterium]